MKIDFLFFYSFYCLFCLQFFVVSNPIFKYFLNVIEWLNAHYFKRIGHYLLATCVKQKTCLCGVLILILLMVEFVTQFKRIYTSPWSPQLVGRSRRWDRLSKNKDLLTHRCHASLFPNNIIALHAYICETSLLFKHKKSNFKRAFKLVCSLMRRTRINPIEILKTFF